MVAQLISRTTSLSSCANGALLHASVLHFLTPQPQPLLLERDAAKWYKPFIEYTFVRSYVVEFPENNKVARGNYYIHRDAGEQRWHEWTVLKSGKRSWKVLVTSPGKRNRNTAARRRKSTGKKPNAAQRRTAKKQLRKTLSAAEVAGDEGAAAAANAAAGAATAAAGALTLAHNAARDAAIAVEQRKACALRVWRTCEVAARAAVAHGLAEMWSTIERTASQRVLGAPGAPLQSTVDAALESIRGMRAAAHEQRLAGDDSFALNSVVRVKGDLYCITGHFREAGSAMLEVKNIYQQYPDCFMVEIPAPAFERWCPLHAAAALNWPLAALREIVKLCPAAAQLSVRIGGSGNKSAAFELLPECASAEQRAFLSEASGISARACTGLLGYFIDVALSKEVLDVETLLECIAYDERRSAEEEHCAASTVLQSAPEELSAERLLNAGVKSHHHDSLAEDPMIPQESAYRFVRLKQSKAGSLDGLRVGQIGFVEELDDDSLSVFMRNLHSGGDVTNAATNLAGVPIAWLECAFKGWLPIHAAAALHWKPDAIVMLLNKMKKDTIRKDLAAKVKGTGGMSAIHLLHVHQCGTQRVEEALLSRMDASYRCTLEMWSEIERSAACQDGTKATEAAAKVVALVTANPVLTMQRFVSRSSWSGQIGEARVVRRDHRGVDSSGGLTHMVFDESLLLRVEQLSKKVLLLSSFASSENIRLSTSECVPAFEGRRPLHAAAVIGWPPETLQTLVDIDSSSACDALKYALCARSCTAATARVLVGASHKTSAAEREEVLKLALKVTLLSATQQSLVAVNEMMETAAIIAEWRFAAKKERDLTNTYVELLRGSSSSSTCCLHKERVDAFIRGGADKERVLLATALLDSDCHSVDLATHILEHCDAQGTAVVKGDGRIASVVGSNSSYANVKICFERMGVFLGRYRLANGDPVHISKTCEVRFATDVENGNDPVALKLMINVEEFKREISARDQMEDGSRVAVGLLGWHTREPGSVCDASCGTHIALRHPLRRGDVPVASAMSNGSNCHRWANRFPHVLVMERGGQSLFIENVTQRFAGVDANTVAELFKAIVTRVRELHELGRIHGDVKLRNIIRRFKSNDICLCDLDASVALNEKRDSSMKMSTAYAAPELQASLRMGTDIIAIPSLDTWSLGVVLFELCTGRPLFAQDSGNDNMVDRRDVVQLANWNCISSDMLTHLFVDQGDERASCTEEQRTDAGHIIRWCLQGDPTKRPTLDDLLAHRFVVKGGVAPPTPHLVSLQLSHDPSLGLKPILEPILARDSSRERFHVFISHMQIEASGDVGTLFHLFETLGVGGWRDMNQDDLTEVGMRQGVYDSDVFVLFLTNSVLSRPYCLKEITWAIEFGKPIIVVRETEERFFPFDLSRWQRNECEKDPATGWKECWLASTYADCPLPIIDLVETALAKNELLPFRRREYEVNALAREIIRRAAQFDSISWGAALPPAVTATTKDSCERVVDVISSATDRAAHIRTELVEAMQIRELVTIFDRAGLGGPAATHVVVVLTRGVAEECAAQLEAAVKEHESRAISYVYLEPSSSSSGGGETDAWDFAKLDSTTEVGKSIGSHEALKYRFAQPELLKYEHDAMVDELISRMRPSHQSRATDESSVEIIKPCAAPSSDGSGIEAAEVTARRQRQLRKQIEDLTSRFEDLEVSDSGGGGGGSVAVPAVDATCEELRGALNTLVRRKGTATASAALPSLLATRAVQAVPTPVRRPRDPSRRQTMVWGGAESDCDAESCDNEAQEEACVEAEVHALSESGTAGASMMPAADAMCASTCAALRDELRIRDERIAALEAQLLAATKIGPVKEL